MTIDELLADILNIPANRITDKTTMKDVAEWDSLKHMELIVGIERHYKIELTGDEIADMISVKAIKSTLAKHGV
jgi:acyl carrier protein